MAERRACLSRCASITTDREAGRQVGAGERERQRERGEREGGREREKERESRLSQEQEWD